MGNPVATFLEDLRAPLDRDPASRGWLDVVLSYPGFHAVVAHRLIHPLYRAGLPLLPRFLAQAVRFFTGIEIHPGAEIGRGVFIDHGMGVVIGETAEVGDGCTIYQGVTLGGTSLTHGKRHPTLGRNVTVGVNAAVLGAIKLGDNVKVGGGSVVVKDVPANATVVGVPARIVAQDGKPFRAVPDRPQVEMPDPNADAIARLNRTIDALEHRVAELEQGDGEQAEAWSWVI
ncbi:MAG TPA: serine O-acetyltransferase [Candidatus Baltobacteraceae bacterium]|jgi:serine O-acetyltransferase|nr:serine O-acetyltransferase [Candidatus Baltobacteraceae bacterium]